MPPWRPCSPCAGLSYCVRVRLVQPAARGESLVRRARIYYKHEYMRRIADYNEKNEFVTAQTRFQIHKQTEQEVLKGLVG